MPGKCEAREDRIRVEAKALFMKSSLNYSIMLCLLNQRNCTQGNWFKITLLLC